VFDGWVGFSVKYLDSSHRMQKSDAEIGCMG
jgi:hypothetical protein